MNATVNTDACTGCELCVGTCPDVFKMEDGLAVVSATPVPSNAEDTCKQAAEECPTEAIAVE